MDKEKVTYLNVNIDKYWILAGPTKITSFFIRPEKRPYPIAATLCKLKVPIVFGRGTIIIKKTVCIEIKPDNQSLDTIDSLEFLTVLFEYQKKHGEKLYSLEDPGTRFNFEPESMVLNYKLDEQKECMEPVPDHYTFFNNPSKHINIDGYKRLDKYFDERYLEMDWLIDGKFIVEREEIESKNKQLLEAHLELMNKTGDVKEMLYGEDDGW